MKNIGLLLDELLSAARSDPAVKAQLLATREQKDPLTAFCSTASSLGYPMDPGELIATGEEYSCNQLKSTNGGGVTPYAYFDDLYDNFFTALSFSF